jgi:hypothetical protein
LILFLQVLPPGAKEAMGVNLDMLQAKDDPTTFFSDGIRKIDFVLVYEETVKDTLDFQKDINNATIQDSAEFDQLSK